MRTDEHNANSTACLCFALRQASRAVSRLYDEEFRGDGLKSTQYSVLAHLSRGAVKQRDLGGRMSLDETTLTRSLRPLIDAGWVAVETGEDRREKLLSLTAAGAAKMKKAGPAWERAQKRMLALVPEAVRSGLLASLADIVRLADKA